jgi:signal transduction histidine kinase
MVSKTMKLAEALARVPERLDGALAAADAADRAARLAEALHALWPAAALHACRLEGAGGPVTRALDHAGKPRPKWAAALEAQLASAALGADGAPHAGKLPASLRLSGHTLHRAPITCRGLRYGALALATPPDATPADAAAARALLDDCADRLALRLRLEETDGRASVAEQEFQELSGAADVTEAFSVFMHELGNILNNLVLDLRLLEREVPEGARGRLAEIGRLAASVPDLLGQLTHFRQARRPAARPVDLNRVAARAVERLGVPADAVRLELAPDLPPVEGTPIGLGRLVRLLVGNALAVTPAAAGPVRVCTERAGDQVRLRVEDGGPSVPEEALPRLFEPFLTTRDGQSGLELAICKTMVRRLLGSLDAANRPEGGVTFIAELPVHSDELHPSS